MTQQIGPQSGSSESASNRTEIGNDEVKAIDFVRMFRLLYLQRSLVARIAASIFLVFTVAAFLIKPRYTATVSFVPPSSTGSSSAAALAGQLSSALGISGGMGGVKSPADLYVGILKSRTIASNIVNRFNLRTIYKVKKESEAEKALLSNTTFEVGIKDSIVSVSVTDLAPDRARDIANGYLEALKSTSAGLALTESSQRRLFYEDRLAKEKDQLSSAEVALKESQEKSGLISPIGQTSTEIQALAQLRAQIATRQVALASLRHDETDENPEVLRVLSEIRSLQSQVSSMENGKNSGRFGNASTAQVPAIQLEYLRKARDVKYHETLFEIIAKQYEAARLDEANSTPLQILDHATIPDSKSGPPRALLMLAGIIVGLFAGCAWVLFRTNSTLHETFKMIRQQ